MSPVTAAGPSSLTPNKKRKKTFKDFVLIVGCCLTQRGSEVAEVSVCVCVLTALITRESHTGVGSNTPLVIFESSAHLVERTAGHQSCGATTRRRLSLPVKTLYCPVLTSPSWHGLSGSSGPSAELQEARKFCQTPSIHLLCSPRVPIPGIRELVNQENPRRGVPPLSLSCPPSPPRPGICSLTILAPTSQPLLFSPVAVTVVMETVRPTETCGGARRGEDTQT